MIKTFTTTSGRQIKLTPKLRYCLNPDCCSPLVQKNISVTHAIKACPHCKRKFTYIRTDTIEGRRLAQARNSMTYRRRKDAQLQAESKAEGNGTIE